MISVRSSVVKSRLVPSEKDTETLTPELVGTETGATAALLSGAATLASSIETESDSASGSCTFTGATPLPRETAAQAFHSTLIASLHSAAAPVGTIASQIEPDASTTTLEESEVTFSWSYGTSCVWPSLKTADASIVPTSSSASSSCCSFTRAANCVLALHATLVGGDRDQTSSVTTADCRPSTVTVSALTVTLAADTDTVAPVMVTEATPSAEAVRSPSERVTAPEVVPRLTRCVMSTLPTLERPAPPNTATAVASVCWYSG